MQFEISKEQFLNSFESITNYVDSDNQLTMIKVTDDKVTLATDNDTSFVELFDHQDPSDKYNTLSIISKGEIAVTSKLLFNSVRHFSEQLDKGNKAKPINFELDKDKKALILNNGYSHYKIAVIREKYYPQEPAMSKAKELNLPMIVLQNAIDGTSTCAAKNKDLAMNTLKGINIVFKDHQMTAQATDSHKLAAYTSKKAYKSSNFEDSQAQFLVAADELEAVPKFFGPRVTELKLDITNNRVEFSARNGAIWIRHISGEFPDLKRVINYGANKKQATVSVELSSRDLLKAVRNADIIKDNNQVVRLHIDTDKGILKISSQEKGGDSGMSQQIPVSKISVFNTEKLDDGKFDTFINPKYLELILKSFDKVSANYDMTLYFVETLRPAFSIYDFEGENLVQLVTPVRVSY